MVNFICLHIYKHSYPQSVKLAFDFMKFKACFDYSLFSLFLKKYVYFFVKLSLDIKKKKTNTHK